MSAVFHDVGYDTRMIKTRKNLVTLRLLAVMKKQLRKPEILMLPSLVDKVLTIS